MQGLLLWCLESLVVAQGLWSAWTSEIVHAGLVAPWQVGSWFLNEGSNLSPLHRKVDS